MARLPSVQDLSVVQPHPSEQVPTYPRQFGRPSEMGQAISDVGATLERGQDQADNFNYAAATSAFLTKQAQIETQVKNDPNWQQAGQTYKDQITQAQATAGQMVQNPILQKKFQVDTAAHVALGANRVQDFMRTSEVKQGRGDLDNLASSNMQTALANPDQAPALISATSEAYDGAQAQGYISPDEAVRGKRTWSESYGRAWLGLQPPDQALHVLTGGEHGISPIGAQPQSANPRGMPVAANAGNVTDAKTGQFQIPASPTDGVTLTANNLRSGYKGMTIQQMAPKWVGTDQPADQVQGWAANVAQASGLPADKPINMDDPAQMRALVRGVVQAEKGAADRALFTPAVINDGVTASLNGQQANLGTRTAPPAGQAPGAIEPNNLQVVAKTGTPADFIPIQDRLAIARQAQTQTKNALDAPIANRAIQDSLTDAAQGQAGQVSPRTLAQFYSQNGQAVINRARALAAPYGDPALTERAAAMVQQQMDRTIHLQEQADKADRQTIDGALIGQYSKGALPTSEQELVGTDPKIAATWQRYKESDPAGAQAVITNLLTANAKGKAQGMGTDFYSNLKQALAPGDPQTVTDASKFLPKVGSGPQAQLTNSGYSALQQITKMRGTPQGEAFAQQFNNFIDQMHSRITASDARTGAVDKKGAANFNKFMVSVFDRLGSSTQQGGLPGADAFDPKSDNFIGKAAPDFSMTPGEAAGRARDAMMHNQYGSKGISLDQNTYINGLIASKAVNADQAARLRGVAIQLANGLITRPRAQAMALQIAPSAQVPQPGQ